MFNRRRNSPTSGAMLLCLVLSLSSATAAQPFAKADEVPENPAADSTPRLVSPTERVAVEGHITRNEGVSGPSQPGSGQLLNDEELAQLSVRAEEPGDRVVGGALTNQQLTYIVIALAAAVVVLIVK